MPKIKRHPSSHLSIPNTLEALGGKTGNVYTMTWTMPQGEASTCGLTKEGFLNNKFKRIGVKFEDGAGFREWLKNKL